VGSGVRFSCVRVFRMRHRVQEVVMHVHTHVPNLIPHLRRSPAWKSYESEVYVGVVLLIRLFTLDAGHNTLFQIMLKRSKS